MVVNEVYGQYLSMDEGEVYKYCKLPNTFERIVLLQTSTLLKTTLKFTWHCSEIHKSFKGRAGGAQAIR